MSDPTRKLAAIMFADIVGYTAMMQADEANAKQVRDRHREVIEQVIPQHAGEIVQYYGDGALSIFNSAKEAVLGALEIQRQLCQEPTVPLRIGIHIGDIVHDDEGIFGDGVNVASRIESLGIPGAVLFSDKIFREIENHPAIQTISLGEFELKNVKRPVGVYALNHDDIIVPTKEDIAPNVQKTETRCIAVMPFNNISQGPDPDYFADGVSEEIVNGLTKVSGLSIISRTTCMAIQNSKENKIAEGRRLRVSHFLEGSVRKAGDRVRVSVQLVNTADSFQLWAETYERNLDDIFEVQDEIARNVIHSLQVNFNLSTEENPVVAKPTDNLDAYTLYLKGMHHWKKHTPSATQKAVEIFNQALGLDPQYSATQCALSQCYSYLGSCGVITPTDAYARALNYALTAIENNPQMAEAHLAMASMKFFHFWDWEGARKSLEKAESLGLSSALLHETYGLYYAAVGKPAEGVVKMKKALEMDPLSPSVMNMLATLYLFNEQYDEAVSIYKEILELEPSFRSAYQFQGVAFMCAGQFEKARENFAMYHKLVNRPNRGTSGLIITNHLLGDLKASDALLDGLHSRLEHEPPAEVEIDLAIVHSGLGNYDKAIGYLEKLYDKRLSIACMGMIWVMRCPGFRGLWGEERFLELMRKMGIEG